MRPCAHRIAWHRNTHLKNLESIAAFSLLPGEDFYKRGKAKVGGGGFYSMELKDPPSP